MTARSAGAVLVHGLTGSPFEIEPLARALAEAGVQVETPRLAGHESLDALERSRWQDWYASLERSYDALTRRCDAVMVVGFSMGSLLALRLCALRTGVAGLVALAVPLRFAPWERAAIAVLSRLRRVPVLGERIGMKPRKGRDVRRASERHRELELPAFPYPALAQLVELQDEVARLLPRVRVPLLVLHGAHDHVARVGGSAGVLRHVSSSRARRVIFPESFHHLALDVEQDEVVDQVLRFARRTLGLGPTPTAEAGP